MAKMSTAPIALNIMNQTSNTQAASQSEPVYQGEDGTIVFQAESSEPSGYWTETTVDGRTVMLWDAPYSNYTKVDPDEALSYKFVPDEGGDYFIGLYSARVKSVMNQGELFDDNGWPRTDTGNDVYVSIVEVATGEVIQEPTKLYTWLQGSDEELRFGHTFDANHQKWQAAVGLEAGVEYELIITGRSDGYALDMITLNKGSLLADANAPESSIVVSPEQPVNQAPVAVNDTAQTNHDETIVVDVLQNDTDPDNDALSLVGVSYNGDTSVVTIENGEVKVNPLSAATEARTEVITYTVADSNGATSTATLSVDVAAVEISEITGDANNNTLSGGSGDDVVRGYGGHDTLYGMGGEDALYGGLGKDLLRGGLEDDTLYGNSGNDKLRGESGNDTLFGHNGDDDLHGGSGNDTLIGGGGLDGLRGGTGADEFRFNANSTSADADTIYDFEVEIDAITISNAQGRDFVFEQSGGDVVISANSVALVTVDNASVVDVMAQTTFDQPPANISVGASNGEISEITGDANNNTLSGGSGDDILRGYGGHDTLYGMGGEDALYGGLGKDLLRGGLEDDTLYGDSGYDKLRGESGNDTLFGNNGNDDLHGGSGNDTLIGGEGLDKLRGGTGADEFRFDANSTSADADTIYDFEAGIDAITISNAQGRDFAFEQSGGNVVISSNSVALVTVNNASVADVVAQTTFDQPPANISGGALKNALAGVPAHSEIWGTQGDDTFVFGVDETAGAGGSPDIILDFALGEDILDIQGVVEDFDTLSDELSARVQFNQVDGGTNVLVNANGGGEFVEVAYQKSALISLEDLSGTDWLLI
ncbi:MAG: Ig-like domain-containing protein [Pseudomonadota bacterium]